MFQVKMLKKVKTEKQTTLGTEMAEAVTKDTHYKQMHHKSLIRMETALLILISTNHLYPVLWVHLSNYSLRITIAMSQIRLQASVIIRSKTYGTTKFSIENKIKEAPAIIITTVLNIMVLVLPLHLVLSMNVQNQTFTHEVFNKIVNRSTSSTREHLSLNLWQV